MMADADFIKTSTGKEKVNARLAAGQVMARMIQVYHEAIGHRVGLKPAGVMCTARQARFACGDSSGDNARQVV